MNSHVCPFCNQSFFVNDDSRNDKLFFLTSKNDENKIQCSSHVVLYWYICPACQNIDLFYQLKLENGSVEGKLNKECFKFSDTDYIPSNIIADYQEAILIAKLSPKASATLSRRCLQGIIRDFWGIKNKNTLYDEINAIPADKITSAEVEALQALRSIGNIGAHPEKTGLILEVEPNEAELMIKLIEFFIENWYVKKHEQDEMLNAIKQVACNKKQEKNNYSNNTIIGNNNLAFGMNSSINNSGTKSF